MKRIRVIGSQQNSREYLYEALDYAAKGKVKTITETYALNDISKAYERVVEGKVRFRAVIANYKASEAGACKQCEFTRTADQKPWHTRKLRID
jgi:hypothetical protein